MSVTKQLTIQVTESRVSAFSGFPVECAGLDRSASRIKLTRL
jgi:hypothetical protein